ncbi:MAG: S9 family peptidase, partial [Candidatus Acidiferrales bacterium]
MARNLSRSLACRAKWAASFLALAVFAFTPNLFAQTKYQKPPKEVLDVLFAPAPPIAFANPQGDEILVAEPVRYPPISELARPMLRIAGVRIDPANSGQHNPQRFIHLALVRVSDGRSKPIAFPSGPGFGRPEWAPDGKHFFLTVTADKSVELWMGDAAAGTIHRLPGIAVNSTLGDPCTWTPDKNVLLCRTVPATRGRPPAQSRVPEGPIIQESFGKAAPAPTFEDLLASPHDEQLFDYYATSQLSFIDVATGKTTPTGKPGIFQTADPSAGGRYILVARIHHPYSYIRPFEDFAHTVEVWDRAGHPVYKLADLPLQETIPIGGVPTGPRDYQWQATAPATLVWVEA